MANLKVILIILSVLLVPILPFVLFGGFLEPLFEKWIESPFLRTHRFAAATAIILLLASDIVLPVPSSFIGTIAGQILGIPGGCLATWLGLNLSCWLGYVLGSVVGVPAVQRFSDPRALVRISQWFERWGIWTLIVFRPLPVFAEASVLVAGLGRMQGRKFWPVVVAANFGIAIAYAALGSYSAEQGWLGLALAISIAVPVAIFSGWVVTQKRKLSDLSN